MEKTDRGDLWPADDPVSEQIREVFSRYGLAMYQVQVLEGAMVNASLVMHLLPTITQHSDKTTWEAAFDEFYASELAQTYGNMLKGIARIDGFPASLLQRLRDAKTDRDTLAHRFFRENDSAFLQHDGRSEMIGWCEDRIHLFQGLAQDVDAFIAPQRQRYGVTSEKLQEAFNDAVRHALEGNTMADRRQAEGQ